MKILLPQQSTILFPFHLLCTQIFNFLLTLSSKLFSVLTVAAREELEHLIPLAFTGVAIKCVCSL